MAPRKAATEATTSAAARRVTNRRKKLLPTAAATDAPPPAEDSNFEEWIYRFLGIQPCVCRVCCSLYQVTWGMIIAAEILQRGIELFAGGGW